MRHIGPRNANRIKLPAFCQIREGEYMIIGTSGVNDEQGIAQGFLRLSAWYQAAKAQLYGAEFTPPSGADAETVSFTGVYPDEKMFLFFKQRTRTIWLQFGHLPTSVGK